MILSKWYENELANMIGGNRLIIDTKGSKFLVPGGSPVIQLSHITHICFGV